MDPQVPQPSTQSPVTPPPSHSKLPLILGAILLLGAISAGSYILGTKSATLKEQTKTITPSPTIAAQTNKTADWKTYTNQSLGLSFKYPARYITSETSDSIDLGQDKSLLTNNQIYVGTKSNDDGFSIIIWENSSKLSLEDWWTTNAHTRFPKLEKIKISRLSVGQQRAIHPQGLPDQGLVYFLSYGKKIIEMRSTAGEETNKLILSTFKFTDQNLSHDSKWIDYTSQKKKDTTFNTFSISYPPSWTKEIKYNMPNSPDSGYTLSFTKNGHTLDIYQANFGGGACIFDGDKMFDGPAGDYRGKSFVEISSYASLRRVQAASNDPSQLKYAVCGKGSDLYQAPLAIGGVTYEVPLTPDQSLLKEMDAILATVKLLN